MQAHTSREKLLFKYYGATFYTLKSSRQNGMARHRNNNFHICPKLCSYPTNNTGAKTKKISNISPNCHNNNLWNVHFGNHLPNSRAHPLINNGIHFRNSMDNNSDPKYNLL